MISVVALMCQFALGPTEPVCREELVTKIEGDNGKIACALPMAALAQWKMNSIYRDDKWFIKRIICAPGDYVIKDAI